MDQEDKITFTLRISEETFRSCRAGMELLDTKSRNEFIEKAIGFYSAYLSAQNSSGFFAQAVSQMMEGIVKTSENRIARLLFKIAVEMAKLEQMLASINEMDDETMRKLHIRCVNEVKKINGVLTMENAVKFQRSEEE